MARMKYCANCQKWVTRTGGVSIIILMLLLLFGIVPGLIYIVWAKSTGGRCPFCNSKNWGKPPAEAAPPPPPPPPTQ